MNFKEIEAKWQKRWAEDRTFSFDLNAKNKFYLLNMFPYPSGSKLHIGHWYQYAIVDSWGRFKKMQGYDLFQPMGFDAFGLPAENYAIKTKVHPLPFTLHNIEVMREQLKKMGVTYDWNYEVVTALPQYYKWTQWLFLLLYKNKLAYRKNAPVNWCSSCQTVLANEQVIDGKCDRCGNVVTHENLTQWFFKITDFSEDLLQGIDGLHWPEKTKIMQRNWIGRSEGTMISFAWPAGKQELEIFTTRPDTLFGVTYLVMAPEHPLAESLLTDQYREEGLQYIASSKSKNEIERTAENREKSGVCTGSFVIHPLTQEAIPVYLADYVLAHYGTGIVMAVPAHDLRDYQFAQKYNLPIKQVIAGDTLPEVNDGTIINSSSYNGMSSASMRKKITEDLTMLGKGRGRVNYRLRDWLISRQRYWGAPIPIIYCPKCGVVPVPEKDLPVLLPQDVDFLPTGESPLKRSPSFYHCTCPQCSSPAHREVDTMDTFVCSSWYFLRYPCAHDDHQAFDRQVVAKILPVDRYVGGAEHACMHLLYSRFITHVLHKLGYVDFKEPFPYLTHQGLILGSDNQKMSKSKGNTVSPDEYVQKYGSDILRMHLMFAFNYVDGGPWSEGGFVAVSRFLNRIEKLFVDFKDLFFKQLEQQDLTDQDLSLRSLLHSTIQRMTVDTERFQFNTSIARLMELSNALMNYINGPINASFFRDLLITFLQLLAPYAPHFAEELWESIGNSESIFQSAWPSFNEAFMQSKTQNLAVMVNGKLVTQLTVATDASEEAIVAAAQALSKVSNRLQGKKIVKYIFLPAKLINFVIK